MVLRPLDIRTCLATLALVALVATPAHALMPIANASGAALYQRECAPCHGAAGYGDGPEAPSFVPPPRDLHDGFLELYAADHLAPRLRGSRLLIIDIDAAAFDTRRKRMVEEIVSHLQRLPDVDWPPVRQGAEIYAERCESCHGAYARPAVPSALQRTAPRPSGKEPSPDFQKALGDADLLRSARGEHVALPGFVPVASEQDAKALLAYLRLLSVGFARYSLWCAGCHGDEGRGDGVFASDVDDPKMVIDRAYLQGQNAAELRRKIMHLVADDEPAMPHFQRELSEGQARAIVAALQAMRTAPPPPVGPTPAAPASSVSDLPPTPRRP